MTDDFLWAPHINTISTKLMNMGEHNKWERRHSLSGYSHFPGQVVYERVVAIIHCVSHRHVVWGRRWMGKKMLIKNGRNWNIVFLMNFTCYNANRLKSSPFIRLPAVFFFFFAPPLYDCCSDDYDDEDDDDTSSHDMWDIRQEVKKAF